jgi:hypothetical protein
MSDNQDPLEKKTFACNNYKEPLNSVTDRQINVPICRKEKLCYDMSSKNSDMKEHTQKHGT